MWFKLCNLSWCTVAVVVVRNLQLLQVSVACLSFSFASTFGSLPSEASRINRSCSSRVDAIVDTGTRESEQVWACWQKLQHDLSRVSIWLVCVYRRRAKRRKTSRTATGPTKASFPASSLTCLHFARRLTPTCAPYFVCSSCVRFLLVAAVHNSVARFGIFTPSVREEQTCYPWHRSPHGILAYYYQVADNCNTCDVNF